jgi:membrane-associated phospholipid phosphatase
MGKLKKNLGIIFLTGLLFLLPRGFLLAETPPAENKINREYLKNFADDFSKVLISPKDWGKKDFLNFSAVFSAGLLFYAFDQDIRNWVQDRRSQSSDDVFNFITHLGDGGVLFGSIAASYAAGEIFDSNGLRKTSLLCLESWLSAGFIVETLKFVVGRARPDSGESSHTFHPFSTRSSFFSFPSGHSASAFAVAETIAAQSSKTYIDVLAYGLASLVALSRVHNDRHWASDVFIGSSIGYFVAKKISSLEKNRDSKKVKINFQFSANSQSFSLAFLF